MDYFPAGGAFFRWEPSLAGGPGPGWRPFTDLLDAGVAAERVARARAALAALHPADLDPADLDPGALPVRVVASVTFLGYAARLLSPLLGAAVAGGVLPRPGPGDLWWQPVAGPLPLACGPVPAVSCAGRPPSEIAELLRPAVDDLIRPLLQVFRDRFVLSPQVLWGNVSSALGGAAGLLAQHGFDQAWDVVTALLDRPPLAGTAVVEVRDRARARLALQRRNCCLYYRIPGGGTCGDCVLGVLRR